MQVALFRKLKIGNKNYYQLYEVSKNFELSDNFADFMGRAEKDYFHIEVNDEQYMAFSQYKYVIFTCDTGQELIPVSSNENEVYERFMEQFHDFDEKALEELNMDTEGKIEFQFDQVTQDVYFQDEAILSILEIINRDFDILRSNVSPEFKAKLKDNIIICGLPGTGKNTTIDAMKSAIDVPYADITLTPDFETNVGRIIQQLTKTANGDLASIRNGIVYIRDNFEDLASLSEELSENPYLPLESLLGSVKVVIGEENFELNLNELIFVIVVNVSSFSEMQEFLMEIENISNIQTVIFNELTPSEQKKILLKSKYSIINIYKEVLKNYNKRLRISKTFIDELILLAKNANGGMVLISDIISKMVKSEWYTGSSEICLTTKKLKEIAGYLNLEQENIVLENRSSSETSDQINYNLSQLVNVITQTVCAQDEHVKRILYTLLRNRNAAYSREIENPKRYIKNILIRGESGSGKTLILTEIAKLLKMPIFIADAAMYTEEGYVGSSVTDMLVNLYKAADGDLERAQRGILVIDEIDKKANNAGGQDVSRGAVLNGLLKIVEGAVIPIEIGKGFNAKQIMFDTSRLTVVCSGAFEDIEKIRDTRIRKASKKNIGFDSRIDTKPQSYVDSRIIDEDYVAYGMVKQFMARFGVIVNLNKLTIESLKSIMKDSKTSELVIQKLISQLEGLTFTYEESFYDALAKAASDKKIGARGIERAFNDVLENIRIMDIDPTVYSEIIFTGECVSDPSKIILVKREKDKTLIKK